MSMEYTRVVLLVILCWVIMRAAVDGLSREV
jgi:hypothetical protein